MSAPDRWQESAACRWPLQSPERFLPPANGDRADAKHWVVAATLCAACPVYLTCANEGAKDGRQVARDRVYRAGMTPTEWSQRFPQRRRR